MNKSLTVVLAASLLVAVTCTAQAEQGIPSHATLRAMGLNGMTVLSDHDALDIRGMGYRSSKSKAIAFGVSYAKVEGRGAGAGSIDGYYAEGKHYAGGVHGSVAGKITIEKKSSKRGRPNGPSPAYTNGPSKKGNNGGYGGGGGGVKIKATIVFAGGFAKSSAY